MNRDLAVVAYRGGAGEGPENGLSTCVATASHCPDAWMEVDVRSTSDGVPVLMHDRDLDRTTDHSGPVAQVSSSALSRVRLKGTTESPPELAALMQAVPSRLVLDVRTGDPRALDAIVDLISRDDREVVVVSEWERILRALLSRAPGIRFGGSRLRTVGARVGLPLHAPIWMVPERAGPLPVVTESWVRRQRARGSEVWVWVVDDPSRARALAELGVTGVFTSMPRRHERRGP